MSKWFWLLLALVVPLTAASTGGAAIAPPWCGTPEPDAAEALPDGTDPADPAGSFPHIPYYAIGCTLDSIASRSDGRMTVEVIGQSALGRDLYLVTINELKTANQQRDYARWQELRELSQSNPAQAQQLLDGFGNNVKVPLFIQGGIHGDEYEGVDAAMEVIERLATTPYGTDPEVDGILDHSVVLFNVVQNPDGRVAGQRQNGNGFDLNRDFLTQAQTETKASVKVMQRWQPPDMLDLHGYLTPVMLIEATTKPHNPSIEYDLWLKWNQARIDANEAALNASGYGVQRPINDWCEDGDLPPASGICPGGTPPGPAVAEGWDDWGPFYTPMYAQHVGMNGSTVEFCRLDSCGGRVGAREQAEITTWSTLLYNVANRHDVLSDELEIYRRNATDAPRPACCPPPFGDENNWMHDYPQAYVIPLGEGQRSDPEANRLVDWLQFNGAEVEELVADYSYAGRTYEEGSYVVWIDQVRRGLIDTALGIGQDVSDRISILYAPPAAWSHGYLWGADVVTVPDGDTFQPTTDEIAAPNALHGGIASSKETPGYALELDSPTAVRTANRLIADGLEAKLATTSFRTSPGGVAPAGSVIFPASAAQRLDAVGEDADVWFRPVNGPLPTSEPIERVPRIAVIGTRVTVAGGTTPGVDQNVWSLRNLGFVADPFTVASLNTATTDPLPGYDLVFNTGNWPSSVFPTTRSRLTSFFASGGGYIGAGTGGANFLTTGGQVTGLTATARSGSGRSGIVTWNNSGGAASVVTGAYRAADTAIMDPPTWFSSVGSLTVDGTLPLTGFFLSGLWNKTEQTGAGGSPVIAHGTNTMGSSRITAFAMNPLYRADPEREWPMLASATYWVDK